MKLAGNSGRTATGKPFEAGKSGNPNGRPKTPESVKLAFSSMMPLALAAMRKILDGTDTDAKASDRIKAADIVFDRNLGKAVETVNMESQVNYVDTSKLTDEQKEAIARIGLDDGK